MKGGVSVVLCTRDGHARGFLQAALDSVQGQDPGPDEIILVDDGSTDGTAAQVARTHPAVRVVPNAGRGLAAARNTGVGAARYAWIAFMDDDDLWCPGKLAFQEAQVDAAEAPETIIWASRPATLGIGAPRPSPDTRHLAQWPACLLGCPVASAGALVSRELLHRMGPFNEQITAGAAYEFWVRCLQGGATVRFSEDILLLYRRHGHQMTEPARTVDLELGFEAMLLPFLEALCPERGARLRAARLLGALRTGGLRCGFRGAARLWVESPLRPVSFGWRALGGFLLDSAAARAPRGPQCLLRRAAIRLLVGAG